MHELVLIDYLFNKIGIFKDVFFALVGFGVKFSFYFEYLFKIFIPIKKLIVNIRIPDEDNFNIGFNRHLVTKVHPGYL